MPLAEPHAMAVTYLRHKERIRGLALRKHLERAYEGAAGSSSSARANAGLTAWRAGVVRPLIA